jgi:DNA-binding transcriptional LysR family regulator
MQIRIPLTPQDLHLVLVLHRNGTLTGAARELGVEQSTLSRRLSALEAQFETNLFLRHQKGLTSGKAVLDLIPWAEKLEIVLRGANQVSAETASVLGEVHISCADGIADRLFAPRVHELLQRHNGLRLRITGSHEVLNLDKLDCDITIRLGVKPRADAVVLKLAESKVCVFGGEKFLPVAGKARLSELPILHRFENLSADSKELRSVAAHQIVLSSNRMTTAILAAEAGAGVVLLPQEFGRSMPSLVEIPVSDWSYPIVPIYLASPRTSRKLKQVDIVWNWIKDIFDKMS